MFGSQAEWNFPSSRLSQGLGSLSPPPGSALAFRKPPAHRTVVGGPCEVQQVLGSRGGVAGGREPG